MFRQINHCAYPMPIENKSGTWRRLRPYLRSVGRIHPTFSDILSLVAVVISVFAIYTQSFRVDHDLKAKVFQPTIDLFRGSIESSLLIANRGNQSEIIVSAKYVAYIDKHPRFEANSSPSLGPVIMKPGEASIFKLSADTKNFTSVFANYPHKTVHIAVAIQVIGPGGQIFDRRIPFAQQTRSFNDDVIPYSGEIDGYEDVVDLLDGNRELYPIVNLDPEVESKVRARYAYLRQVLKETPGWRATPADSISRRLPKTVLRFLDSSGDLK